MKQKIVKQINYWLSVTAIGLVLGLSLQFARAWTEPTAAPPGGNVGAPINTGNLMQAKGGGLMLNFAGAGNGLIVVNGEIGLGELAPQERLDVNGNIRTSGGSLMIARPDTAGGWARGMHYVPTGLTGCSNAIAGIGMLGQSTTLRRIYLTFHDGATFWDSTMGIQIESCGNVGIGTIDPTQKLDVNGVIRAMPISSATCDADAEGGIYYDSDTDHFYGCDGNAWKQLDN